MKNSIKISHSSHLIFLLFCLFTIGSFSFAENESASITQVRNSKNDLAKSPTDLKLKIKLAENYIQNKQFNEAIELLKPDSELLPRSGLLTLAKAYGEIQDWPNQGRIYEHLSNHNPKDYEALTLWGEYFITVKQDEDAIRTLRMVLNIKPNHKNALEDLILVYQNKNNNFELRLIYQDLIKYYGKRPEYVSKLCKLNTMDGFYDAARKYCISGTKIDGTNPENYLSLAYIEHTLNDIPKSTKIIKIALKKFPESDIVLTSFAAILIRQKNFAAAKKYFLQATKINPELFESQIGLANSSFESNDFEISLGAFKKACKLEPHKAVRELKRASNFIRYKSISKWEDPFSAALEACLPSGENSVATTSKKKKFVLIADLRKTKPYTPFTVPLTMDIKIAADPASIKKPDGSTIFKGQEPNTGGSNSASSAVNPDGNSGTFTSSSFAPANNSPFQRNGAGAGHTNDNVPAAAAPPPSN